MISGLHLIATLVNLYIGYYSSWGLVTTFSKCTNVYAFKRGGKETTMFGGETLKPIWWYVFEIERSEKFPLLKLVNMKY